MAIRGVSSASRAYFRKEVHELTVAESALLAGMIRAPNTYSPSTNPARARERRDVVLGRMRELGRLSEADYQEARREPVRAQLVVAATQPAPYFADPVRQELEARFGSGALSARDVRVFTSLDLTLQRLAENAVERGLARLEAKRPTLRGNDDAHRLQAALVVLDPATGQIRALVGGRSYQASQFNRAIDRKSTRLNSSHDQISYAVFCLKKKKNFNTSRLTSNRTSSKPICDRILTVDKATYVKATSKSALLITITYRIIPLSAYLYATHA